MARYLLLALNGPTQGEGDADALERWYAEEHLPAFHTIKGVKTARRYKILRGKVPGVEELWPNAAAYEIETDDMASVSADLAKTMTDFHPALDRSKSANLLMMQIGGDA